MTEKIPLSKSFIPKVCAGLAVSGLVIWTQIRSIKQQIEAAVKNDVLSINRYRPTYIYIDDPCLQEKLEGGDEEGLRLWMQRGLHKLQCSSVVRNLYYRRHKAWRLLQLSQDEDRGYRLRSVRALAELRNLSRADYQQLGQACDLRTAVGLARSDGASLHFLLDPPYFKLKPNKMTLLKNLHEFLSTLDRAARHSCLHQFLSDTPENKNFDDDLTVRSSHSTHIPLYVEQMLHHSSVDLNAKYMVTLGGLPLLTEVYKYLTQQDSGNADAMVMLTRLASNISVLQECHQALFTSGWVKLLAVLAQHPDIRVSAVAARALANMDQDELLAGHSVTYHRRVYPLHPTRRSLRPPRLDVVFIHGLLGGVFVTWRQRDQHWQQASPLELLEPFPGSFPHTGIYPANDYIELESNHAYVSPVDEQATYEVVLSDLPVDGSKDVSGPYYWTRGTIKKSSVSKCWPRDWLALDCPDIRIIGINYETNLSMWAPMCSAIPGRRELQERSTTLIKALTSAGVGQRPVVWVAHSMGGLLVKDMLVKAMKSQDPAHKKLYENTKGIVFFSTPHKGSNLADFTATSQMILLPSVEVQELRRDSPHLLRLHQQFLDLIKLRPTKVLSFAERKPTYVSSLKLDLRFVDDASSEADVGELYGIPLDHLNICKPFCRQSFLYQKVVSFINEILEHTGN